MPRTLSLLAVLSVIACGDDATTDEPSTAAVDAGPAPVFVAAGEPIPGIEVEPGYGWTILHCGETEGVEVCMDVSERYMLRDGYICGPIPGVEQVQGTFRPVSMDCGMGAVEQDRWFRAH